MGAEPRAHRREVTPDFFLGAPAGWGRIGGKSAGAANSAPQRPRRQSRRRLTRPSLGPGVGIRFAAEWDWARVVALPREEVIQPMCTPTVICEVDAS